MSTSRHLVIMARAPRLGTVKRRLARDVGAAAAWRFYRTTAAGLVRRVARDSRWQSWLAVTPDQAALGGGFGAPPCRMIAQGPGNLGARMGRVLRDLPPGPVVIVGSDIPALDAAHVARAFALLGGHDWVFGPATDGGYWLIGARRRPVPPRSIPRRALVERARAVRYAGQPQGRAHRLSGRAGGCGYRRGFGAPAYDGLNSARFFQVLFQARHELD